MKAFLYKPFFALIILLVSASPILASEPTTDPNDPTIFGQPEQNQNYVQPIPTPSNQVDLEDPDPQNSQYPIVPVIPGEGIFKKGVNFFKKAVGFGCSSIFNPIGIVQNIDPTGATDIIPTGPNPCDILDPFLDIASGNSPFGKCGVNPACWIASVPEIMIHQAIKMISGCSPQDLDCLRGNWNKAEAGQIDSNSGALIHISYIAGVMHSLPLPVSTGEYLANMSPFKGADASGFGDLTKAEPIFTIWKNFRNAAYALSIVALVIVGFLIMFRTKLDSKTAVSLTNSIPKIIVMLLLITFSFAIAGLMIDFARVLMQLFLNLIGMDVSDFGMLFVRIFFSIFIGVTLVTLGGGVGLGFIMGLIVTLLVLLAICFLILKIIYNMIIRYAQFLVGLIFAPVIFLAIPLPKGTEYAKMWFKKELGYILTIPISFAILALGFQVANSDCLPSPFGSGIHGAVASLCSSLGNPSPWADPFGLFSIIAPFIGLGIVAVATKAPQIADDLLGNHGIGGHGGGGHGGGLLGSILFPLAFLEEAGDVAKNYKSLGRPGQKFGANLWNWARGTGGNPFTGGTPVQSAYQRALAAGGGALNVTEGKMRFVSAFNGGSPITPAFNQTLGGMDLGQKTSYLQDAGFSAADTQAIIEGRMSPLEAVNQARSDFGWDRLNENGERIRNTGRLSRVLLLGDRSRSAVATAGRALMDPKSREHLPSTPAQQNAAFKKMEDAAMEAMVAGGVPLGSRWEPADNAPRADSNFPRQILDHQRGFTRSRPRPEEEENDDH